MPKGTTMARRACGSLVVPVVVEAGNIVIAMYALDVHRLPKAQALAVAAWQNGGCIGSVYDYLAGGHRSVSDGEA